MLNKRTATISQFLNSLLADGNVTFVPHANEMTVAATLDTMRALWSAASDILMVSVQIEVILIKISC